MSSESRAAAQTVDAVVQQSATEVDCRDLRNTRISEQRVYRLLHERASDMARFEIACSKWQKLTDFNGQVTDATGKVIRKFKKGDLRRSDLSSGFADDFYTLSLDYTPSGYPITIEFNWVCEGNSGSFGFPTFAPVEAYNTQVEHASYVLTAPAQMACRYLCQNTTAQVTESTQSDGRIRYEAHMPSPVSPTRPLPWRSCHTSCGHQASLNSMAWPATCRHGKGWGHGTSRCAQGGWN